MIYLLKMPSSVSAMRYIFTGCLMVLLMYAPALFAQETWSLQRCVDYALEHNIQIKQADIQKRLNELILQQSRLSRLPNLSAGINNGFNFGRSIDPTTNQFVNNQLYYLGGSVNMSLNLFSGLQKTHTIQANKYTLAASEQLERKMENDVALNVATAYLQILLNTEQLKATQQQLNLSLAQLENTRKQVIAGALPESNLADMQAQVASDTASLITAENNLTLAILQMKAILNLPSDAPFAVDTQMNVDAIPVMNLDAITPEQIYEQAVGIQPQVLADSLTLLADKKQLAAAKGALYPTIYLSGSLGTNYASTFSQYHVDTIMVPPVQIGTVNINGVDYKVNSLPQTEPIYRSYKSPLGSQLNNNFNQSIGIGVNIPIFNGYTARTNVKRAQLNLLNQQLTAEQNKITLRQNIFQAYADAKGAREQYRATIRALEAARIAYDYATQRYDLGLLSPVDYLTSQNNLFKATINMLTAKYNYIFKVKVLEFYQTLRVQF
ncbi:outer membrane protein [Thermoflavifilum aggregans]|uniref:Outer membrane protein n=2 Tax=Thermoflavifilum aggregans TaxID=454188 RepID=A0A2M9CRV8_9BACT|nr:outer membrane protein [Thermoflavifilum aggregans]